MPLWSLVVAAVVLLAACRTRTPVGYDPLERPHPPPSQAGPTSPAAVAAPSAFETSFDLRTLLDRVAERNPRLGAARRRWLAARERPTQARSLPDPMLTYVEMVEPIQTRVGPNERGVGLSQRLPFPGKLAAAGAEASEEARVRELDYHIALRDTFADAKVAYAELVYLHRAVEIVRRNQALAAELAQKATAGYAGDPPEDVDPLTLFDTLAAQSSVAQLAYDAVTLEELLAAEAAEVNGLLHREPQSTLGAPRALPFRPLAATRAQLHALALSRRQEIQAAIHKVRAAYHARRLARLSQVPDLTLGVQYTFIGDAASPVAGSGDDAVGLQLGVTLPLWGAKNRARIAQSEHEAAAAALEREAREDDVTRRLAKLYFRLQNAERLVELYAHSLIPQAEQAMQIAEQQHQVGREPFARLLEARSIWLNFQLAHQRALADHEQMVARMEQLVGIGLEPMRGEAVR